MIPLGLRLAARELRGGIKGFRIFLACLALGVAAIAAAGSTAEAFRQGLASQARAILGGDLSVSSQARGFTPAERAVIGRFGQVVYAAGARAMAQAPSGERRLVEIRGVGPGYPLAGTVSVSGAPDLAAALAPAADGTPGAAAEPALADRLGLKLGDRFMVGDRAFVLRALLLGEPDRIGRGFALGPRVLTRLSALAPTGLIAPGYPHAETARIALPPGVPLAPAERRLRQALAAGDLDVHDRNDAAPGARRLIDQLNYFLGFIGLTSLLAGGLGVSTAVEAYLGQRKPSIAVLKALGAEARLVRDAYLAQIGVLALAGVILGLAIGAAIPLLIGAMAKTSLPFPALFALYPAPLLRAGGFGLLAAAAFALGPLARARATPPAALFRQGLAARPTFGLEAIGAVAAALGLAVLTLVTAPSRLTALAMIGAVAAAFLILWLLGRGTVWTAGRLRGLTRGALRLGLANLAGPRSAARVAAPAIGLGVALLSAVMLIQSSLLAQVQDALPRAAPALVFTEIPQDQGAAFDAAVSPFTGGLSADRYQRFPLVTGRVIALDGRPLDKSKIRSDQRWAYDNDISLSVIGAEPHPSGVEQGAWWPADYSGPPLAVVERKVAEAGGLKVGAHLTVEVLGREITAQVAATRKVDWGGFGPDFVIILDPAALAGAPLRSVAIARLDAAHERALTRALGTSFPQVNVISVREQLEGAAALFGRLALAVRGAASVAALAGLLVLAGAVAAGAGAREREAALLKVLGAARGQVLAAYAVEYGAIGLVAGLAGGLIGAAAAWPVVTLVFEAPWSFDAAGLGLLIAGAAALTGLGGVAAALAALARRPAPALRAQ